MEIDFASVPRTIAYARLGYAVGAMFTPKLVTASLGAKPSQMTPAAMAWAGVFATREAALAAVTLTSEQLDPATRRKVLLANAAIDAVDTVAILALVKRQRNILPLLLAVPAGVFSAYSHYQAARQLGAAAGADGQRAYENAYATA
jgi:hypothetical protein